MKLANLVTLSRLVLSPFFLLAFCSGDPVGLHWAFALAVFFEVTDMVDGFIARRMQQVSQLGKILDPLADSVSRFTVFLAFLDQGYATVWMVAPIFWRDSIVSTIRVLAASQGIVVSARFSGKVKAIVQGIATIGIVAAASLGTSLHPSLRDPVSVRVLAHTVMTYVAVVTVWSLFDYLWGNRDVLRKLDA